MKLLILALLFCSPTIASNLTWSFPPFVASTPGVDAKNPHVAIGPNGSVTVVWEENGSIKARSKPSGGAWESIITLASSNSSEPSVVMDENGEATAIWNNNGTIKVASKPLLSGWDPSTSLSLLTASSPRISVNTNNDLIACWTRLGNIESATKLSGGNWPVLPDVILSVDAENPQVALGGVGANRTAIIVWEEPSGAHRVIKASNKLILGAWSLEQTISNSGIDSRNSAVAIDENGNGVAIWYQYEENSGDFSSVTVEGAKKPQGSAWEPVETISFDTGTKNPENLMLKVISQEDEETLAMWGNSRNDNAFEINARLSTPRIGDWDARESKIAIDNLHAFAFDVASNSFGNAYNAYMFTTSTGETIILSSGLYLDSYRRLSWSVPLVISSGAINAFPSINANFSSPTHRAAAAWVNSDGSNTEIQVLIGESALVAPPTGLSVQQNSNTFGSFTEYFNTVDWTDSTSPNIKYYVLSRNKTFLNVVSPGVQTYVDHNQVQGESVSYEISTVDTQNFQSHEATITLP